MRKRSKIPFEFIIAVCFNMLLIMLFCFLPGKPQLKQPVSVEVDIIDYTLPEPKIIPELKQDTNNKADNAKSSEHSDNSATKDNTELEKCHSVLFANRYGQ